MPVGASSSLTVAPPKLAGATASGIVRTSGALQMEHRDESPRVVVPQAGQIMSEEFHYARSLSARTKSSAPPRVPRAREHYARLEGHAEPGETGRLRVGDVNDGRELGHFQQIMEPLGWLLQFYATSIFLGLEEDGEERAEADAVYVRDLGEIQNDLAAAARGQRFGHQLALPSARVESIQSRQKVVELLEVPADAGARAALARQRPRTAGREPG
jgi:hypothetical protein